MGINKMLDEICKQRNILATSYCRASEVIDLLDIRETTDKKRGLAFAFEDTERDYIFFDGEQSESEKAIVMAHEIGHHVMEHLRKRHFLSVDDMEIEANMFGAVLMAMCVFEDFKQKTEGAV